MDINLIGIKKGEEIYAFLFDDAHREEVCRVFGQFASNAELSFTWHDAAVLSTKVAGHNTQMLEATWLFGD